MSSSSLCQRLGLTRSVRNKPRAPEARESAGGARGFAFRTNIDIRATTNYRKGASCITCSVQLNGSQLVKMKKSIPDMFLP